MDKSRSEAKICNPCAVLGARTVERGHFQLTTNSTRATIGGRQRLRSGAAGFILQNKMPENRSWIQMMRTETASDHALIEGAMPVLEPDFDLVKYQQLLRKLYGFYRPFEAQIYDSKLLDGAPLHFSDRAKLKWLETDILKLDPRTNFNDLPLVNDLPNLFHLPDLLGALYVTEGSTLGGSVIERHLKANPKFEGQPLRFFKAHGAQTGKMWREFVTSAEASIGDEAFEDSAKAAKATFSALRNWLMTTT